MTANLLTIERQLKSHQPRRVLLIEDNDVNRMLLRDYLSYCGYNVESLSDGSALFPTIEKFQPELLLLDLKLPDIDGYVLLEQIQQKQNLSKIPIIVVSAFAFKADKERAINLGAKRYFIKPIDLNELLLSIEEELSCIHI
ncbi:response regulator [Nostoc sp. UHCC 0702]|nr:response regulator [Nostoc sp. UHCC 0702]